MGVVVRRYIDILTIIITYPYSACISSFFATVSLLCSFLKCFFRSCLCYLCNIANVAQRTFKIVQKLRSREHGDIIILTRTSNICRLRT